MRPRDPHRESTFRTHPATYFGMYIGSAIGCLLVLAFVNGWFGFGMDDLFGLLESPVSTPRWLLNASLGAFTSAWFFGLAFLVPNEVRLDGDGFVFVTPLGEQRAPADEIAEVRLGLLGIARVDAAGRLYLLLPFFEGMDELRRVLREATSKTLGAAPVRDSGRRYRPPVRTTNWFTRRFAKTVRIDVSPQAFVFECGRKSVSLEASVWVKDARIEGVGAEGPPGCQRIDLFRVPEPGPSSWDRFDLLAAFLRYGIMKVLGRGLVVHPIVRFEGLQSFQSILGGYQRGVFGQAVADYPVSEVLFGDRS